MSGEYLRKENWPECIPWTEPTEQYAPTSWWEPDHDPDGIDQYNWKHPDAASLGELYMGDVCPCCGVPVHMNEAVIGRDGQRGTVWDVSPTEDQQPVYHRECYMERRGQTERKLTEFASGAAGGETDD